MSDFASEVDHLEGTVRDACAPHDDWPARVAAGVQAAVGFFVEHPQTARTLVNDLPADGLDPKYISLVERFAQMLSAQTPPPTGPAKSTERALVGGIASVIAAGQG